MAVIRHKFEDRGETIRLVVNDDNISKEIAQEDTWYEHWLLNAIEGLCGDVGGVWVDVGANVGNHAIYWAKFCKPEKILCFEPNPDTCDLLRENCTVNGVSPVIYQFASGSRYGTCAILVDDINKQGSAKTIQTKSGSVMVWPIDIVVGPMKVGLIKIDVEGNEFDVIDGAIGTIRDDKPELFIETWGRDNLARLKDILCPIGYELKERYCHAPVYHFSVRKEIPVTYQP